jgi:murein DD-endopeptidase MepM/ murein hydrolase activator NlpD
MAGRERERRDGEGGWFAARTIVVRRRGSARVVAFDIGARTQKLTVGLLLAGALWAAAATWFGWMVHVDLDDLRIELYDRETRLSEAERRERDGDDALARRETAIERLEAALANERALRLAAEGGLRDAEAGLARAALERETVTAAAIEGRAAIDRMLAALAAADGRARVAADRQRQLTDELEATRARLVEAEDAQSRAAQASATVGGRVGRLEIDLDLARRARRAAEAELTQLRQTVDLFDAETRDAQAERDRALADLAEAEARHRQVVVTHQQALAALNERARRAIGDVERVLAAAGLDARRLAPPAATPPAAGRGGPFLRWTDQFAEPGVPASPADARAAADLARLETLRQLLDAVPVTSPIDAGFAVQSGFGHRRDPFNGRSAFHTGVDLQAPRHTAIRATAAGKVTHADWSGAYGRLVEIDHGHGIRTRYAHLSRLAVKAGAAVARGDEIGSLGSSGRSTGHHLHYEVLVDGRHVNPTRFMKAGVAHVPEARPAP